MDRFLSRELAKESGQWSLKRGQKNNTDSLTITLNEDDLKYYISKRRAEIESCRTFFASADYCEVYYEDIATSFDACVKSISATMGPLPGRVEERERLIKQVRRPASEVITNYDDVRAYDGPLDISWPWAPNT